MVTTEPATADRLLLVDVVAAGEWLVELAETVMIRPGQRHWFDDGTLHVQSPSGALRTVRGVGFHRCVR
ncbi:hypothetical protein [Catellatospora tritici]|uniref:hypothetical protein n=1 Tax=Catellatospora tritici TaxID=2851566 RepID=UPI001C2D8E3E|nr:hypothetical protein [Catellatospora tritici]MBV1851562.1 hypothetical protein [Catellatospora tritici]